MAMLAEPRRKQKWSVDPRNSAWCKDESKFGHKMLEKMGWSRGKGLGAKEQGSTEHIKVQLKNNTLGLGATVNHEDNWLAHQDDFNQILAQLNNCHGQNEADVPATEEKKCFSLEEKSKTSKKRVHYMKFAKGKDLSCRSDTDLACIFGKRPDSKKQTEALSDKTQTFTANEDLWNTLKAERLLVVPICQTARFKVDTSGDSQDDDVKQNGGPLNVQDPEATANTVTSTLSVAEYFAKRMAQRKSSHVKEGAEPEGKVPDSNASAQPNQKSYTKSKKNKKRKSNEVESSYCKEEPEGEGTVEQPSYEDHTQKKKKKRKRNKEDSSYCKEEPENGDTVEQPSYEAHTQKKKRKRNEEENSFCKEEPENKDKVEQPSYEDHTQKKKRKRNKEENSFCKEEPENKDKVKQPSYEDHTQKKKRKGKHLRGNAEVEATEGLVSVEMAVEECDFTETGTKRKKKKAKKSKN